MPKIIKGGVEYGSAPNSSTWEGTQAQYDAIVSPDPNVTYFITDGVVNPMPAKNVEYDNTLSGLSATTVQGAIDEVDGKVFYGVCDTEPTVSGNQRIWTVTLNNGDGFALTTGATVYIKFTHEETGDVYSTIPYLNVNDTGAKSIYMNYTPGNAGYTPRWREGQVCVFTYDGNNRWFQINPVQTAYLTPYNNSSSGLTATDAQSAINEVNAKTVSDGLHNITLESGFTVDEYMNYFKIGKLVVVNIGGVKHNAATASALVCQGLPVMRSRALGVVANDNTTNKVTVLYGAIGSGYFRISAHEANVRYYGQITYLTD